MLRGQLAVGFVQVKVCKMPTEEAVEFEPDFQDRRALNAQWHMAADLVEGHSVESVILTVLNLSLFCLSP